MPVESRAIETALRVQRSPTGMAAEALVDGLDSLLGGDHAVTSREANRG